MTRVLCGVAIGLALLLAPGLAAPASAAVVDGGTLTPGVAVTATIALASNDVAYRFAGVSGQHVTFDVSASSWTNGAAAGYAYLRLYDPVGTYRGAITLGQGVTYGDWTLTATGTWRVLLGRCVPRVARPSAGRHVR